MSEPYLRVAACGLDCTQCDLRLMIQDQVIQERLIAWFRDQGWLSAGEGLETVLAKGMYCKGCKVDAKAFWSDRCQIAICCMDDRGLAHCGQCGDYPCARIVEHASKGGKYAEGVAYLRQCRSADQA